VAGGVTSDLGGRLTGEGHVLPVRVYYEDTDTSGSVYHGSYVRFLERGRSDYLRLLGVVHARPAEEGLHFAITEMRLSFQRTARIDDVVEVVTKVAKLTGARVVLEQAIRRDNQQLVAAEVTVALLDRTGRPARLPAPVRDALAAATRGR